MEFRNNQKLKKSQEILVILVNINNPIILKFIYYKFN